jgi:hypothetical protein
MLARTKPLSNLDLNIGNWQVNVHPDDKETMKTTFSVVQGLWQFVVMPFDL